MCLNHLVHENNSPEVKSEGLGSEKSTQGRVTPHVPRVAVVSRKDPQLVTVHRGAVSRPRDRQPAIEKIQEKNSLKPPAEVL